MLHTKFHANRSSGSGEYFERFITYNDYGHGGYSLYICLSICIFIFCVFHLLHLLFVLPICILSDLGGNKISYLILFIQNLLSLIYLCCMPSFKIIGLPILEKKFLKLFTIYGRGVHLGHVILDIYTNFRSQFRRRRMKFGFDLQSGFREDL